MNKEFIPYEQALALKELGFDEPCFGEYYYGKLNYDEVSNGTVHTDIVLAPLYQQAFRWFREKHELEGFVFMFDCVNKTYSYHIDFTDKEEKELYTFEHVPQCLVSENPFSKYEEAELACLIKLIEIVKTK